MRWSRVIDYLRPCKRAMRVIEQNLDATHELQEKLDEFEQTLTKYAHRNEPDPDGKYRRREDDSTWPRDLA